MVIESSREMALFSSSKAKGEFGEGGGGLGGCKESVIYFSRLNILATKHFISFLGREGRGRRRGGGLWTESTREHG